MGLVSLTEKLLLDEISSLIEDKVLLCDIVLGGLCLIYKPSISNVKAVYITILERDEDLICLQYYTMLKEEYNSVNISKVYAHRISSRLFKITSGKYKGFFMLGASLN